MLYSITLNGLPAEPMSTPPWVRIIGQRFKDIEEHLKTLNKTKQNKQINK